MPVRWGGSSGTQGSAIADATSPTATWGSMKLIDEKVNEIIEALEDAGVIPVS